MSTQWVKTTVTVTATVYVQMDLNESDPDTLLDEAEEVVRDNMDYVDLDDPDFTDTVTVDSRKVNELRRKEPFLTFLDI